MRMGCALVWLVMFFATCGDKILGSAEEQGLDTVHPSSLLGVGCFCSISSKGQSEEDGSDQNFPYCGTGSGKRAALLSNRPEQAEMRPEAEATSPCNAGEGTDSKCSVHIDFTLHTVYFLLRAALLRENEAGGFTLQWHGAIQFIHSGTSRKIVECLQCPNSETLFT